MKIIQSFFANDSFDSSLDTKEWLEDKYSLFSSALSCLQLREFYNEVELITDTTGKKILIDSLKLPYSKVDVVSAEEIRESHLVCKGLAKVFSSARQNEPFIYIDSDVFIWREMDLSKVNRALFSFRLKKNDHRDYKALSDLKKESSTSFEASETRLDNTFIELYQCKVFGGTENNFFIRYFNELKVFFIQNPDYIKNSPPEILNSFLPDYFFYHLAKKGQKQIHLLIESQFDETQLKAFEIFNPVKNKAPISYIPSILKNEINTLIFLGFTLRHKFPYHYFLAEEYFNQNSINKKTKPNKSIPSNKSISTLGDINEIPEKSVHIEQSNSIAKKVSFVSFKNNFVRTLKALQISSPNIFTQFNNQEFTNESFIEALLLLLNEKVGIKDNNFITDIFSFERSKYEYSICDKKDKDLINSETRRFEETNNLFFDENEILLKSEFILSKNIFIKESMWKWGIYLNIQELFPLRVIYNFSLPPGYFQTLFWMESITFSVWEYDMDEVDIILLNSFDQVISVKVAIENLINNFEVINNDTIEVITSLAIKRLKEYYYRGALELIA